jgi:hypothetical protein
MIDTATGTSISWFPFLTAFAGFLLSSAKEWLSDRRTHRRELAKEASILQREREARETARQSGLYERRITFQRQTLLELQDVVVKYVRAVAEMHSHRSLQNESSHSWDVPNISAELSDRLYFARAQSRTLAVRVSDDSTRSIQKDLSETAGRVILAKTKEAAETASLNLLQVHDKLNNRIGEILRKLDDDAEA